MTHPHMRGITDRAAFNSLHLFTAQPSLMGQASQQVMMELISQLFGSEKS